MLIYRCVRTVLRCAVGASMSAALALVPAPAMAGPAVRFPMFQQSGCGPNNVEGWQFQTTAGIVITALGVYDSGNGNGLDHPIPVGLFDAGCVQLAAVTVPAGTVAPLVNGYRYVTIQPVVLAAGLTYRAAAVMRCDDFTPHFNFDATDKFTLDSSLTAPSPRRIAGGSSLVCPTQTSSIHTFGANFLIGPACGNAFLQPGEECDDGNTADGDCCSSKCTVEDDGSPCADDDLVCSADLCQAGVCTHSPRPASMECRPAEDDCDVAEHCDGVTTACPTDGVADDGTPCTDDDLFCSGEESCQDGTCISGGNPCETGTCDETADACVTPTGTVTATRPPATPTSVSTSSATVTGTRVRTPTAVGTATAMSTATAVRTPTAVSTATALRTATAVSTATAAGTSTAVATASAAATSTVLGSPTATAVGLPPTPTHTPSVGGCAGDCDGSGAVSIGELITGVNIALSGQAVDRCRAFDTSGDGAVSISELIAAVNNALNGCP